jgi:S-adenosylmethionine decarboxylase
MGLFGATHLTMELAGCNKAKLKDQTFMKQFLDNLPSIVGMSLMRECEPMYLSTPDPLDSGSSAVTLLKESHSSYHSFDEMGVLFIDLFSCKDFHIGRVAQYIIDTFESDEYHWDAHDRSEIFDLVRARINDNSKGQALDRPSQEDS